MDKLINLAINGVLDIYIGPGINLGDLTEEEIEKYSRYGRSATTYNILSLIDSVNDLNNENEVTDTLVARLLDIQNELRVSTEKHNKEIQNSDGFKSHKQPSYKEDALGNVYLMLNRRNNYYKIGFTKKDPSYRETTLQAQEPEVELVDYWMGSLKDEENLHNIFQEKRLRGEWFSLAENDIHMIEMYFKGA
jgi:hypothetical protein